MSSKKNLPPESLVYTGVYQTKTDVKFVSYNADNYEISDESKQLENSVNWTIFTGLSDTEYITKTCESNGIDLLIIEDILNVSQRSKIHVQDNYIFSVLKSSFFDGEKIEHDYISVVLFRDKLFTFHESNSHVFDPLIKRIENNIGKIRSQGHDFLYYAILDLIVDNDIEVRKVISLQVAELEDTILNSEDLDQSILYNSRKELLYLKSNILFFNDLFSKTFFEKTDLIKNNIDKYFVDLHDHITRLSENIDNERELIRNLLDIHLNNVSNKMNAIMKTLTIFSAIFIPLSFLAGVFGMNFVNFPSLQNENGIYIFIFTCFVVAITMILFFKKRNWF